MDIFYYFRYNTTYWWNISGFRRFTHTGLVPLGTGVLKGGVRKVIPVLPDVKAA